MKTQLFEILSQILRPPGGGIPVFSAGKGAAEVIQQKIYQAISGQEIQDPALIESHWKTSLKNLGKAQVVLLGVPSDTGAGIRRGAAYGPRAIRLGLLEKPEWVALLKSGRVVDLGDVYVNPHLLHDEMLNEKQIQLCQEAMYPQASAELRKKLAVSALSQLKQVLNELLKEYPHLKIFVIGGDHSVAWPVTEALALRFPKNFGIVQSDAHTDLLSTRLGVQYCFGTWSFHANQLLGGHGKLVQVGVRQSGRDRNHWESTTEIRQFWAEEIDETSVEKIIQHLKKVGVEKVYFSNDIDGTDALEAPATGTPVPNGISSSFLLQLIDRISKEFELVAADIMEVAPDLGPTPQDTQKTIQLAAEYSLRSIQGMIKN